jgi:5'-deoxynucleotidase
MISRMKYINRWSLMRNEHSENLCEHSFDVASISHALAVIGNRRFGKNYNAERCAALGLYHDAPETLTGDMPTPVKYDNDALLAAYRSAEKNAAEKLLARLPEDLRGEFAPLVREEDDPELQALVKAADRLSALIKCMEERKAGNTEFREAERATRERLTASGVPEVQIFMDEFLPAYEQTLDTL